MYFVYALVSEIRNYIYVGITDNLDRRITAHQKGYNKTTKPYRPFWILLTEEHPTRIAARNRERHLKSGVGKEYLKALIAKQNR